MYQQRRNVLIAHAIKSKKRKLAAVAEANVQEVTTDIVESVVEPVAEVAQEQEVVTVEPIVDVVAQEEVAVVEPVVEVAEPAVEPQIALKILNTEQKAQRKVRAKKS
jgi:hypothetical protein